MHIAIRPESCHFTSNNAYKTVKSAPIDTYRPRPVAQRVLLAPHFTAVSERNLLFTLSIIDRRRGVLDGGDKTDETQRSEAIALRGLPSD